MRCTFNSTKIWHAPTLPASIISGLEIPTPQDFANYLGLGWRTLTLVSLPKTTILKHDESVDWFGIWKENFLKRRPKKILNLWENGVFPYKLDKLLIDKK